MDIKVRMNRDSADDKMAEVEITFKEGPFEGLKVSGLSIWQPQGNGNPQVRFVGLASLEAQILQAYRDEEMFRRGEETLKDATHFEQSDEYSSHP